MIDIAMQDGNKPVQVIDIGKRQNIARESIAVLMVDLKRAGLVASVRGPAGGYRLTRDASDISIKQIVEALEGSIEVVKQKSPKDGAGAAIHETWRNCLETLVDRLEQVSLDDIAKLSTSISVTRFPQKDKTTHVPDGYAFNI